MGYCLLTGATGLLGGYLLRDLLRADLPVAVLVRRRRRVSGRQRIDGVLGHWEHEEGRAYPRPVVLEGDLHEPGLGLTPRERAWVSRHCDQVLHSAASVRFHQAPGSREPYASNVDGTRHLLGVCEETGLRTFHHVSTAYVAGARTGRVLEEELDTGQVFGNDYERSKTEAEQLIRDAGFMPTATVFRPSIILGDRQTGYASSFQGLYRMLQLGHLLYTQDSGLLLSGLALLDQLGLTGEERKNVVTVDWVAATIGEIVRHPACHGRTYHLTSPHPVTTREIFDAAVEAIRLVLERSRERRSHVQAPPLDESGFHDQWATYRAYLRDDPEFDTANLQNAAPGLVPPPLDHGTLVTLFQTAIQSGFRATGRPDAAPTFDVAERLHPVAAPGDPSSGRGSTRWLQLEVSGPGGGAWRLAFERDRLVGAEVGVRPNAAPRIYLSVHTLEALCRRRLDVDGAIAQGLLIVEGGQADTPLGIRMMRVVCDHLTAAATVSPLTSGRSLG